MADVIVAHHEEAVRGQIAGKGFIAQDMLSHAMDKLDDCARFCLARGLPHITDESRRAIARGKGDFSPYHLARLANVVIRLDRRNVTRHISPPCLIALSSRAKTVAPESRM